MRKKVFVGLSGGVDSSVSALLLKNQGYDVTGVFIKGWQPDWVPCTWKDDRLSAMRTAAYLDIPFVTLDLEQSYKEKVVSYLLDEYKNGRTPNPDMLCNREIKFGKFLSWAMRHGADYVATGHYAQINISDTTYILKESSDKDKDQSYFLSQLTKTELSKILFPIGHLQKKEVREIARKNNLPVATRKDSQGICFVGDLEMKDFLKKELKPKKGDVLNTLGEVIGEHDGAILYTNGERHGFKLFRDRNKTAMYVTEKNLEKNTITVTPELNEDKFSNIKDAEESFRNSDRIITVRSISFTNRELKTGEVLGVRVRYRSAKKKIQIMKMWDEKSEGGGKLDFIFLAGSDLVVSGQFAVFYDGDICLGGGEIC
jgi:tRNA-specific 2-thiouridylase